MVTEQQSAKLREPFGPDQVGKLPKGGTTLDYVGHGAVTDRLLSIDPEWNWEPLAYDTAGMPAFVYDADLNPIALWIKLTVCGVTRLGVGTCPAKQFDAEKVLIGDALRNAAMRFGVALDLWIRGQAEDDEAFAANDQRQARTRRKTAPADPTKVRATAEQVKEFDELRARMGEDQQAALKAWFSLHGVPPVAKASQQQAADAIAAAKELLPKSEPGGATDREAVEQPSLVPADAGGANVDTPPGPANKNGEA